MDADRQISFSLSLFHLKCIAITVMTIDHIGALFFPGQIWLRTIGRIAFPIYAFLIANGFLHTHSRSRYLVRLLGFALLSQIPYTALELRIHNRPLSVLWQNPTQILTRFNSLFVLAAGLAALWILDRLRRQLSMPGHLLGLLIAGIFTVLSYYAHFEYAFLGIPLITACYEANRFRCSRFCSHRLAYFAALLILSAAAVTLYILLLSLIYHKDIGRNLLYAVGQMTAMFLLCFYNGKKGPQHKIFQLSFYLFYPVHQCVLVLISLLLQGHNALF